MSTSRIVIADATFYVSDDHQFVWDATSDSVSDGAEELTEDAGKLLIRLDVDGQMDIVYADLNQTGDLAALDRAITALETVRDGLERMYAGSQSPGRCLAQSDWGRCYGTEGRDAGEHKFPTEADSRALRATGRPARAAS